MNLILKPFVLLLPFLFVLSPLLLELSLLLVSFTSLYLVIKKKIFKFFDNFYFKIILLFSIYLLFSLFFFYEIKIGYKYSIFYIRYAIYVISLTFILDYLNIKKELLISFLIVNFILIFDTFFEEEFPIINKNL